MTLLTNRHLSSHREKSNLRSRRLVPRSKRRPPGRFMVLAFRVGSGKNREVGLVTRENEWKNERTLKIFFFTQIQFPWRSHMGQAFLLEHIEIELTRFWDYQNPLDMFPTREHFLRIFKKSIYSRYKSRFQNPGRELTRRPCPNILNSFWSKFGIGFLNSEKLFRPH